MAGAAIAATFMAPSPAHAQITERLIEYSARGWGSLLHKLENLPNRAAENQARANRGKARAQQYFNEVRAAAAKCDRAGMADGIVALEELLETGKQHKADNFLPDPALDEALAAIAEVLRLARAEKPRDCPEPTKTGASPPQTALTTGPQTQLQVPSIGNLGPNSYAAWEKGMKAIDECDMKGIEAARAEMKKQHAQAEANYVAVFNAPRVTAAQYDDARNLVEDIAARMRQFEKAAKDCPKKQYTLGNFGLQLVGDSDTWCEFGPTDPRDLDTPDGDDPRDADTPDGDDPRDTDKPDGDDPRDKDDGDDPRDQDDGDDPRDQDDGDDPRDKPVIVPDGDDPRDKDDDDDPRDEDDEDDPRDEDDGDDPRDVPLIVKATGAVQAGTTVQQAVAKQQIKLFAGSQQVQKIALPIAGADKPQTDASLDPLTCTTKDDGTCTIPLKKAEFSHISMFGTITGGLELEVAADKAKSYNILVPTGYQLAAPLAKYVIGRMPATEAKDWITVLATNDKDIGILDGLVKKEQSTVGQPGSSVLQVEENLCRTKLQEAPNDPHYRGKGAWKQAHDDQWAIKRVGLTPGPDSAWAKLGPNPQPVIVAVIDSGLDWNHADFDWANIWKNGREIPDNGIDDDKNGYVDDVIGWDFLGQNNKPWDHDGHGTLTSSIIAAHSNNGVGMAGINPHARIMVLKSLNAFGHSRASFIAEAIRYAADNGARIVNLSAGGPGLTGIETDAIAYARGKGVLIVVASGNDGVNVADFGPAASEKVLTIGSSGLRDEHLTFSNWGPGIDLAAPGADVLGLRARRTDTVRGIAGVPYQDGDAYVGADKRYYRVSGTSFSAPIVAGIASLVLSKRPELTVDQLETILVQSAQDIQTPGRDNFSGAGMVDARKALDFDPGVQVNAAITGVEVVQTSVGPAVRVLGTIAADQLRAARIEIGAGANARQFRTVADGLKAASGALADIAASNFASAPVWTIRLVVIHANGTEREARFVLDVGG